jgi:methyl-accepting chemotaxis protein
MLYLTQLLSGIRNDSEAVIADIKANEKKIDGTWAAYMATYLTSEETVIAKQFAESYKNFTEGPIQHSLDLAKAGPMSELAIQMKKVDASFKGISLLNDNLIQMQLDIANRQYISLKKESMIDLAIIALCILVSATIAYFMSNNTKVLLNSRISYVDSCLSSIARGNLTTNIEIKEDELQTSLGLINALQAKLYYSDLERKNITEEAQKSKLKLADDFEQRTAGIIKSLAAAATEMQSTAGQMAAVSNNTVHASQVVASAAAEADSNVQTVAAATEELSASSSEIARQILTVSEKSNRASNEAIRTSQQVGDLNSLADSIGDVVGAIKGIAEQTNLLALNATIEAARAGEAGKGFAVVADEVKKLATETASKTIQIDERVSKIQTAIRGTVEAVGRIINDVKEIDHSTATVASAVEEQNVATAEIGRNVSEASNGTQQVAENITNVKRSAEETGDAASNLNAAANELAEIAESLQDQVSRFLSEIRNS